MNQVNITGRLGGYPELKTTTGGTTLTTISVAVFAGKDREPIWVPVVAFKAVAEFICAHFIKGDPIEISGRLRTNQYTKPDGTVVRSLEVEARDVSFPPSSRRQEATEETNRTGSVSVSFREEKFATVQTGAKQSCPVTLGTPSDAYAGFEDADGDTLPF